MVGSLESIFIILIDSEFMIGILGNGFITLVNCIDWIRLQKISSADRILTALAISRICMILVMMVSWFTKDFYPSLYMERKKIMIINIAGAVASHFSVWLATGLSLFYFLKIANFTNAVFLLLKRRVEVVVLVMLLGALVFLPLNLTMITIYTNIRIHSYERNMTLSSKSSDIENFLQLIAFIGGSLIPFTISLSFFLLLIFSLLKHLKKMKQNATGFRDSSIKAHVRAMIMVVSFLILFAIYFLSNLMITFHYNVMQNKLVYMLVQTLTNVYPSVHSFVLILGNGKLRKASLSVLWQLTCG